MASVDLEIRADAYELRQGGRLLARLDGAAAALLEGAGERLRDIDIEHAIERSEDWLMPVSKRLAGLELQVHDRTDGVARTLGGPAALTSEEIEQAFTRIVAAVARAEAPQREIVAHLVLLRELVHHGRVSCVRV